MLNMNFGNYTRKAKILVISKHHVPPLSTQNSMHLGINQKFLKLATLSTQRKIYLKF